MEATAEKPQIQDVAALAQFFRALADETRLKIVGLLAGDERSVEEITTLLGVRAPTVSHHLERLKQAGFVTMRREGTTHVYQLDTKALRVLSQRLLAPEARAALVADIPAAAWERKVLGDFLEGDRLKEIPASRKKREVILSWLAHQFQPGERYPEAEVNTIIQRHHPDAGTLRRELIGMKLLLRAGGVYWRPVEQADA